MTQKKKPVLRFKGFTDDWEQRKLGELAEFNPKASLPDSFEYVDLESVVGTRIINHRTEKKDSAPSRAQRLAQPGDVFYQTVRPYQRNNCLFTGAEKSYVFSTGYAQLRSHGDSYFLLTMLQKDDFVNSVMDRCTGTSYPAINSNELAEINVIFPTIIQEQKELGQFFKNIDNLITLHQRKYEKLRNLKKFFLEKIFPQNGKRVPEVRFAGFTGDWEQRKLGDVLETITDYVAAGSFADIAKNVKYKNSPDYAQLIRTIDLKNGFTSSNMIFVDKKAFDYLYRVNINKECIILPNIGNCGEVYYVKPENLPYKHNVLGPNAIFVRSETIENGFLSILFQAKDFQTKLKLIISPTGQTKFNKTELKDIDLILPSAKDEQKKISFYFENLDNLITLHQRKLEKLQNLKKAALDKMFV